MTDMKRVFYAHPLMAAVYMKPFLFVLLIPVLKAGVQFLVTRQPNSIALAEGVIIFILLLAAILKTKKVKIVLTKEKIKIRLGLIIEKNADIDRERISTVEADRNVLDFIFGCATVKINTEAGRDSSEDFSFKLKLCDAKTLLKEFSGEDGGVTLKFSTFRVAIMAAATSSAITGIIVAVPIIKKTGDLLEMAISDMLLERINTVGNAFGKYIPPIINVVTLIFLSAYLFSFVYSLLLNINFKVLLKENKLEIERGFFVRKKIQFRTQAVNDVYIEQTPLMRPINRFLLKAGIAGYGKKNGEMAVIVPSADKKEVKTFLKMFFPTAKQTKNTIKPEKNSKIRFFIIPIWITAAIIACGVVLSRIFKSFDTVILFLMAIALFIMLYYFNLANYNYRHSELGISNIIYARYSFWTKIRKMYCDAQRIGVITVRKWPADRFYKTCNVKFTVRSQSSESIVLKHISYDKIMKEINEFYNITNK